RPLVEMEVAVSTAFRTVAGDLSRQLAGQTARWRQSSSTHSVYLGSAIHSLSSRAKAGTDLGAGAGRRSDAGQDTRRPRAARHQSSQVRWTLSALTTTRFEVGGRDRGRSTNRLRERARPSSFLGGVFSA